MKNKKIKIILTISAVMIIGILASFQSNNKVKASDIENTSHKEIILSNNSITENEETIKDNASQSGQEDFIVTTENGFHDPDSQFTFEAYEAAADVVSDLQLRDYTVNVEERNNHYNNLLSYFDGLSDGKDATSNKSVIDCYYVIMGSLLPENYLNDKLTDNDIKNIEKSLYHAGSSLETLK